MHRGAQAGAVVVVFVLLGLLVWKTPTTRRGSRREVDKQQVVPAYPF